MSEPTREQIIKACKCCQSRYADCVNCPFYCFAMNECGDCVEAIVCSTGKLLASDSARIAELEAEVKRLKEERRWIPVSEKMPTDNGKYFVLVNLTAPEDLGGNQTEIRPMKYHNGEWRIPIISPNWINQFVKREVTHWQQLPQPPEESEGSK